MEKVNKIIAIKINPNLKNFSSSFFLIITAVVAASKIKEKDKTNSPASLYVVAKSP